ncbi:MAG TPA: isochorismatase family protein [Candidatus Latescibacteria bacterium]|nr:isochorismatase family protein [Candidatus Latescibacterota bacterium]
MGTQVKGAYFTPDSVGERARHMLREVEPYRRRHISLVPKCSALVVLDMQEYFLKPTSHAYVPSAEAILPRIQALVRAYARRGFLAVFTRHVNSSEDAGVMERWWRELIAPDHPLSGIVPELDTSIGVVLEKHQYDAFYGTELEELLRRWGVGQVVVCGVMTHLCCETTARSAFVRGFEVFFPVDGTATYNEAFHRAALLNLSHGFAVPVLVEEVLRALE